LLPDGLRTLEGESRPAPPFSQLFGRRVDRHRRRTTERDGVQAVDGPGEILLHVPVHPLDDAHDGHEEHDADDDADHGEEALELLGPDLGKGEEDAFTQVHGYTATGLWATSLSMRPSLSVMMRWA